MRRARQARRADSRRYRADTCPCSNEFIRYVAYTRSNEFIRYPARANAQTRRNEFIRCHTQADHRPYAY